MSDPPPITVMTCVYNGRRFLRRCYYSLAIQTHRDWEWLVIDDGSTDDTPAVLERIAGDDPRVRVLRHTPNRGRAIARTRALEAARGEWIAVWDVDDFFFPERLARIDLARRDGLDYWTSRAIQTDAHLRPLGVQDYHRHFPGLDVRVGLHGALACRLELARAIGYAPHLRTFGGMGEDSALLFQLALKHRGRLEAEALMVNVTGIEVVLRKSMDARAVMIDTLEGLWRRGEMPVPAPVFTAVLARMRRRNRVLGLLRVCPALYPLIMRLRMRGRRAPGAKLTDGQIAFIRSVGARFDPATGEERPEVVVRARAPAPGTRSRALEPVAVSSADA